MIVAPDDGSGAREWPPVWTGTIVVPDDPFPPAAQPGADPVALAETRRARASRAFDLVAATTEATRGLDQLAAAIDGENDWRDGIDRFNRGVSELRRKHDKSFSDAADRAAFDDHVDRFAALRRMDLRQSLVDSQHAAALGKLDETLAYYAGRAAQAKYPIERDMFTDSGMEAIERLREAGYMGPQLAALFHTNFTKQIAEFGDEKPDAALLKQALDAEAATQDIAADAIIDDVNELERLLIPLVEKHGELRPQLEALRVASGDPAVAVQLAQRLVELGPKVPSAAWPAIVQAILQHIARAGGGLGRVFRRPTDREAPPQLPRPKSEEPEAAQNPVPPSAPRPRAPDVPPLQLEGESAKPPRLEEAEAHKKEDSGKKLPSADDLYRARPDSEHFILLPEGRFLKGPDGTAGLGEIPAFPGSPHREGNVEIRLRRRDIDHVDTPIKRKEAQELGYRDGLDLTVDVTGNWTDIREGHDGRLILVKRNGQARVAVVELESSARAYEIITAGVRDPKKLDGETKILWQRARTSETAVGQPSPLNPSPP